LEVEFSGELPPANDPFLVEIVKDAIMQLAEKGIKPLSDK
jgi:hypothetical protein